MRPIDADALEKDLAKRWDTNDDTDFANKEVWRALMHAPTIDAEPVRHGRWVLNTDMSMHCSECEEVFRFDDKDECLDFMEYAKYCIACGARMDEEKINGHKEE